MENTAKLSHFKEELNLIKDEEIKEFTRRAVEIMPDYFFEMPASTSGKYHPAYALGKGGLLRHTKAAVKIAFELFTIHEFNQHYQDYIISSLILHDGWKCGDGSEMHTQKNHPTFARDAIEKSLGHVPAWHHELILDSIASHMGQWTADGLLPEPVSDMQKFVHLCDYLASRKFIEIKL